MELSETGRATAVFRRLLEPGLLHFRIPGELGPDDMEGGITMASKGVTVALREGHHGIGRFIRTYTFLTLISSHHGSRLLWCCEIPVCVSVPIFVFLYFQISIGFVGIVY